MDMCRYCNRVATVSHWWWGIQSGRVHVWQFCPKHSLFAEKLGHPDLRAITLPILNPDDPEVRRLIEFGWILGETDPDVAMGRARWGGARETETGL